MTYRERAPIDPVSAAHPGFYRVPEGMCVEVGDQALDREGRTQPMPLDQVGRTIATGQVVLRVDRRQREE